MNKTKPKSDRDYRQAFSIKKREPFKVQHSCITERQHKLPVVLKLKSQPARRQTNTNTVKLLDEQEGEIHLGRARGGGSRGLTLPDSLTAGRGEAMPWEKAEAAEKGSGAFSLSPIGSRRSRAEQTERYEQLI